ncbi:MAG: flagellar hook-length control protein FliK, partial [Burkholderiaceae bacterium]
PTLASSVLNKSPIIQNPSAGAPKIAAALRDAIRGSGIFYESHVAEWADGKRSLTNLQQEPQARLAEQAARILAGGDADAPQKIAANTAEMARLVSQQLDTLEHQRAAWRGEAWPGQPMEWDVEQYPGQNQGETADGAPAVPATWQSTVRFDMPSLGKVAATVYLQDGQLRIHVSAASDHTRAALQAQREKLSASLDAVGSPLSALLVKHDAAI